MSKIVVGGIASTVVSWDGLGMPAVLAPVGTKTVWIP